MVIQARIAFLLFCSHGFSFLLDVVCRVGPAFEAWTGVPSLLLCYKVSCFSVLLLLQFHL